MYRRPVCMDATGDMGGVGEASTAAAAEVARAAQQVQLDERLLAQAAQDASAVLVFFFFLATLRPSPSKLAQLFRYLTSFSCLIHIGVQKLEERLGEPVVSSYFFPAYAGVSRKRSLVRLDNVFQIVTVTVRVMK